MATSYTANLQLEKVGLGDSGWAEANNRNLDALDTQVGGLNALVGDIPSIERFSGTFNSSTGTSHTLGTSVGAVTEYGVKVTPTTRAGAIDDIYVTKTTTNFTVKCSAANTTDTYEATVYYTPDASQFGGSVYRRWIVSPDASITDHSASATDGSLANVLADVSSTPAVVELPGNCTYTLTAADVTVASNVRLDPQPGAIINVATGREITINGPFLAHPLQECFSGPGTITFGDSVLMVHAAWFGMPAVSGADNTTKLGQALSSGLPVYCHSGTYPFTAFQHTLAADLLLTGPEDRSAIFDGDDSCYFRTAAAATEVRIHNIRFQDFAPVLDIRSALQKVELINLEVDSSDALVRHNDSYLGVAVSEVLVEKCYIHDSAFGVQFEGYNYQNVIIRDNRFEDLSSATAHVSAIQVGSDSWTNRELAQKFIVSGNIIDNIDMTDTTNHDVHGIYLFAREVIVSNNILKSIDAPNIGANNGCEGIYVKARWAVITGNVLYDAGFNEGSIAVKGRTRATGGVDYRHPGYNIIVANNNIHFSSTYHATGKWDARGLGIGATEDVLLARNYVDGATEAGIYFIKSASNYAINNLTMEANVIRNTRGNQAIYVSGTGTNWRVCNNNVYKITGERNTAGNALGILIQSSGGDVSNVSVLSNTVLIDNDNTATNAIAGVALFTDDDMDDVTVKNNDFFLTHTSVNTRGVYHYNSLGVDGTLTNLSVVGNDMRGLTYPISKSDEITDAVVSNNPGYNTTSNVHTSGGANATNGTTAGYARTQAAITYTIGYKYYTKASTDDVWDLTSITTGASEYKKILLCLDVSGNGVVMDGTAAASQSAAEVPLRRFDTAAVAVVEIGVSYAGGSLSGFTFYDIEGIWPD